jgi:predicted branched-subunit amino acid permease
VSFGVLARAAGISGPLAVTMSATAFAGSATPRLSEAR